MLMTAPPSAARSIRPPVLLYPLGLWLLLAVLAVVNAALRELVIIPRVGEYAGHVVSTVLLVGIISVVSALYFTMSTIDYTRMELVLVGGLWVALTVGFEFLVGYLEGIPVEETVAQYNVLAGRVWIVVPITLFVAPLLFGWYVADRSDRAAARESEQR